MEEIELADKVGLDIYAIGEHHRKDYAVSASEIILAAELLIQNILNYLVQLQYYHQLIQYEYIKTFQ